MFELGKITEKEGMELEDLLMKESKRNKKYEKMWKRLYKKLDFLSSDARYKGAYSMMNEIKQKDKLD